MCTKEELAEKVTSLGKQLDDLTPRVEGAIRDIELVKPNLGLINEVLKELKAFKEANIVKHMEEDIAVLNIMRETQQSVNKIGTDVAQLRNEMETRPCYVNPKMYDKFMRELDNEIVDTKGRIFLILDKSGKVVTINHYGSQLIGIPADEIVGKQWIQEFIPEHERKRVDDILESLVNGEMNGHDTVINGIVSKSGVVQIRWKNYIFRDKDDVAVSILSLGSRFNPQDTKPKGI